MDFFQIVLICLVVFAIGFLLGKFLKLKEIAKNRKEAVKKSREVILGDVYEKISPLLENFPYSYKDLVFLGKGVDYIVFDGLSSGNLSEIVFLEIKTGKSTLNKNERDIRNVVNAKKIRYEEFRM
ncbi:MAG: Holliday junction resolvase-like protein [Candidatus Gracilibacteria bacterium]|nr:Holliday junction resolvase-like protein [Candidatus Gracilibacteria bacterium]MDD3120766.1 Holliday junction resolvase-like protein [Candidatus Gracilibacteria bacterium]MDD4530117.1 Holliday junction resolvase-like protein [Candidatus Gracilibacteria bacterium]